MVQRITISLEHPISSARILKDRGLQSCDRPAENSPGSSAAELSQKIKSFTQAAAAISMAAAKLKEFHQNEFAQHNQQIAKLAVEIARKVLVQEVNDGHYKIEAILQEALRNAPSRDDVIVHLNPNDAAFCRQMQEENGSEMFGPIKIIADSNVKQAECIVETSQGIVESFMETHLRHIAEALANAQ